jgi:phosphoribosylaminoimidazolecarboxamide formyltransferase/IMP cyclohydrolase
MRALLSVEDKTDIVTFARDLVDLDWEIISTGGTAALIASHDIPVTDITSVTGFTEMLDGRVKTLHPAVHGAILARRDNADHMAQIATQGIAPIDLVACNLYDFAGAVAQPDVTLADAVDRIDIGGVTLLRAAAKNCDAVTVVLRPEEYAVVLEELRAHGQTLPATRRRLAAQAFAHTAAYDGQIALYLAGMDNDLFPSELALPLERIESLRYGENPHQHAAFYRWRAPDPLAGQRSTIAGAEALHGKQLGYNNLMDLDAALTIVSDFAEPAAAVIKHAGPSGIASSSALVEAFRAARDSDPVSAFGGIIGLNRPVDVATAEAIHESHFDAIIASDFDEDALELLELKRKNLILVATHRPIVPPVESDNFAALEVRRVSGGVLLQTPNHLPDDAIKRNVVTDRAPTEDEWRGLLFAWKAVKHVKSNAIVLARHNATVGIGGGQPNRLDSVRIAITRAGNRAQGSVLASDAYFAFADNVEAAAAAGITAIIQPGGSIHDAEVIQAANAQGLAMVFTGFRAFRH